MGKIEDSSARRERRGVAFCTSFTDHGEAFAEADEGEDQWKDDKHDDVWNII